MLPVIQCTDLVFTLEESRDEIIKSEPAKEVMDLWPAYVVAAGGDGLGKIMIREGEFATGLMF